MRHKLLFKGVAAFLLTFLALGVSAQESGTTEETVKTPTLTTLTADDGNTDEYYYEGNVAVLVMSGSTADDNPAVSGVIYKWSSEKAYTKEDFASHSVPSATTVTMPATIVTLEGRTVDYYLTAIAYKTGSDGKRIYSDAVSRKYVYKATDKKELTLSVAQSPITLDMTQTGVTNATTTISAQDGEITVTGLSYNAYCSNRKIAESTMSDATLTVTGENKYGVATVMIITKGNDTYKAAFTKVNVNVKTTIEAMPTSPAVYKSIADFRAAGEQNLKQTGVLQFDQDNPATVVARLVKDDQDMEEGTNSVFIVDNSGYGLMIYYETDKGAKFIDDNNLYAGSSFTGTLIGQYKQRKSTIPEISEMIIGSSITINEVEYTTNVTVDHSGEGTTIIGASVPVTDVADIYTINNKTDDSGDTPSNLSYGPYLNTIVSVPGTIKEGSQGEYYLVQDNYTYVNAQHSIYLNVNQIGKDLKNYVNLSGTFTGLIIKRKKSAAKLVCVTSNFFNAEEISDFKISETDEENYVKDIYETGALENNVNVKIHRTNWTTNTWGTICLPFDLTATEFETAFGTSISALASCSGTVTDGVLQFTEITDKNIAAGVPYLIKVTSTENINGTGTDKTDENSYYATIPNKKITAPEPQKIKANYDDTAGNAIINGDFYFCGLYGKKNKDDEGKDIAGNQQYQYISTKEGQYLYYLAEGSTLSFAGLRAYLYFPNWNSTNNDNLANGSTPSSQTRALVIGTGEGTTAIQGIAVEEQTNGKVFNLSGQYVGNSTTSLAKGIYIRDGKKFVVK